MGVTAEDRCRSQWRQFADIPSWPVIRCARLAGHDGQHYDTAERRQWERGNVPDAEGPAEPGSPQTGR